MKLIPTGLPDAMIVEIEPLGDERGFFARAWCAREFAEHGSGNLQDSARIDTSRCDRSASTRPPGIHICLITAIFRRPWVRCFTARVLSTSNCSEQSRNVPRSTKQNGLLNPASDCNGCGSTINPLST